MIDLSKIDLATLNMVRNSLQSEVEILRNYRISWWLHWASLAEMFLPRRYRWFITPDLWNKGSPINASIVDETGVLAARTLSSGLLSGLTSPTKPWFRLGLHGVDTSKGSTRAWLAECEARMAKVYSESNFYQALGDLYHDNGVFGSSALIQYEDFDDVIRFHNPCLGEFFFKVDAALRVVGLAREFTYTCSQCADFFGLESLPTDIKQAVEQGGGAAQREVVIYHMVDKNMPYMISGKNLGYLVPKSFPWREAYWCQYGTNDSGKAIIRMSGFKEKPFVGARWDVTSNDPYGRSPGMDALPAVRQLQIEQRRKAEAIDKMVRPPMIASVGMKNEPMDILPGGVSFVPNPQAEGFKPAFQVEPRIAELMEDLKEVQARVNSVFFVDLFMMISSLDTVRTATEIDARREEKLIQLGPVIERFENEVLDPIIERTFSIMARRGLFPPPPPEIAGKTISVQYISMLAEAQRAASTAAIERVFSFAGSLAGVLPNILDNLDADEAIDEYADLLGVSPKIIRDTATVAAIRAQKAQQEAQAQQLQSGMALSQGAANLSKVDVGGGKNAVQAMLGG